MDVFASTVQGTSLAGRADLFTYVTATRASWTELAPTTSPSVRSGAAMAFDAARGQVVLFGGYDPSVGDVNETWVWNGATWS